MADLTVRLKPAGSPWEVCGVDRMPGVYPESFTATANEWGSETCSFQLRRPPDNDYPDLTAYADCEVEIAGKLVWSGRIREAPTREGADAAIQVSGVGWQVQLDDDVYERIYVHTRLDAWQDYRSSPAADLNRFITSWGVEAGPGAIKISHPPNAIPLNRRAGVLLDLGPYSAAKRVIVEWETSANDGFYATAYLAAGDSPVDVTGLTIEATITALNTASGTFRHTLATARRYVLIFVDAAAHTPPAEIWFRAKAVRVFADTAYESGGVSVLKADTVVKDARDRATLLLSNSNEHITAADFNIDDLAPAAPVTPREVMLAVNAFHRWRLKIREDKKLHFGPQPNSPIVKVGAWGGSTFEDASAGSGEEIYNRVLITARANDGRPVRVERTSAQLPGAPFEMLDSPAAVNPSAATDLTGWSETGAGALERDTTLYNSSPASVKFTPSANGDYAELEFTGTFIAGLTYRLDLFYRNTSGLTYMHGQWGDFEADDWASVELDNGQSDTWRSAVIAWTPRANRSAVTFRLLTRVIVIGPPSVWRVDDFLTSRAHATLVDRRGFRRTKILDSPAALTVLGAQKIGDVFLATHRRTPLKGSVTIRGQHGVRRVIGGAAVHPSELLTMTTELLRLDHRTDPDTGAQGRDGIITSASYTHREESASVALDNDRQSQEALLARLGVVQGRVR